MSKRRYSKKYLEARRKVYKRDKGKCQYPDCNSKRSVVPHHIRKWADHPGLRDEEKNLILLCHKHHCLVTGSEERYQLMFMRIVMNKY